MGEVIDFETRLPLNYKEEDSLEVNRLVETLLDVLEEPSTTKNFILIQELEDGSLAITTSPMLQSETHYLVSIAQDLILKS